MGCCRHSDLHLRATWNPTTCMDRSGERRIGITVHLLCFPLSISTSLNDMSTYHPVHPTLQAAYIHLHVHIQPTDLQHHARLSHLSLSSTSCAGIYPGARMMSQALSLCIRSYLVPLNRVLAVACQCSLGINGEDRVFFILVL